MIISAVTKATKWILALGDSLNLPGICSVQLAQLAQFGSREQLAGLVTHTLQLHALHAAVVPHPLLQALLQQERICRSCQRLLVCKQSAKHIQLEMQIGSWVIERWQS